MTQNILARTRCYLSGHMEFMNGQAWRNKVKEELKPSNITFLDPYLRSFATALPEDESARNELKQRREDGDFEFLNRYFKTIRSDDLRLCDLADFFIAHISPSVASWGSSEELTTANRMKKPIFISVEGGKKACPLWIFGMVPHKYIYDSIDDIIGTIKKIDSGEIAIDSDRWRLLNYELR